MLLWRWVNRAQYIHRKALNLAKKIYKYCTCKSFVRINWLILETPACIFLWRLCIHELLRDIGLFVTNEICLYQWYIYHRAFLRDIGLFRGYIQSKEPYVSTKKLNIPPKSPICIIYIYVICTNRLNNYWDPRLYLFLKGGQQSPMYPQKSPISRKKALWISYMYYWYIQTD